MAKSFRPAWNPSSELARLWSKTDDGRVVCHLSPRQCKIREGQVGFCRVRQNVAGELVTLNYGRATHVTQESIETEAVFHYSPGAAILSLGNIGCMMNCDYCHNWKTSQARYVEAKDVHVYTPEDIVTSALERNVPVLSWTYNDPVVWHEFVRDTGRLGKQRGLVNLFKSAFFISLEGAAELCEEMDIFSVSIKTMDEALYRKISKGWLQPVLDATKYVYDRGKHVEVSNLMVTDANDSVEDARRMAEWVLTHLSADTPLHFVRFHPDYKYTHVGRTPIERLARAREAAMEMGIRYCYIGNVYGHEGANTYCPSCRSLLVERFGLNTWLRGLTQDGRCSQCGEAQAFKRLTRPAPQELATDWNEQLAGRLTERTYQWHGDINACHVELINLGKETRALYYWRLGSDGEAAGPYGSHVHEGDSHRFIISREAGDERGIRLQYPPEVELKIYEVFDRAHYPTIDIDTAQAASDRVPLPSYRPTARHSKLRVVE